DPATGKVIWEMGGADAMFNSSPAANEELIVFGTSSRMAPGFLCAVKAGAKGDITLKRGDESNEWVLWHKTSGGPNTASPLLHHGHLSILGQGNLTCYEATSGKQAYRERLNGARGFTASPFAAGGKVYVTDEDGTTFVIQAGPKYELVSRNRLPD